MLITAPKSKSEGEFVHTLQFLLVYCHNCHLSNHP